MMTFVAFALIVALLWYAIYGGKDDDDFGDLAGD